MPEPMPMPQTATMTMTGPAESELIPGPMPMPLPDSCDMERPYSASDASDIDRMPQDSEAELCSSFAESISEAGSGCQSSQAEALGADAESIGQEHVAESKGEAHQARNVKPRLQYEHQPESVQESQEQPAPSEAAVLALVLSPDFAAEPEPPAATAIVSLTARPLPTATPLPSSNPSLLPGDGHTGHDMEAQAEKGICESEFEREKIASKADVSDCESSGSSTLTLGGSRLRDVLACDNKDPGKGQGKGSNNRANSMFEDSQPQSDSENPQSQVNGRCDKHDIDIDPDIGADSDIVVEQLYMELVSLDPCDCFGTETLTLPVPPVPHLCLCQCLCLGLRQSLLSLLRVKPWSPVVTPVAPYASPMTVALVQLGPPPWKLNQKKVESESSVVP